MKNNNKKKSLIFKTIVILVGVYFLIYYTIGDDKFAFLKKSLYPEQKSLLKKYLFPHKYISELELSLSYSNTAGKKQQQLIQKLETYIYDSELKFKETGKDIQIIKEDLILSNNKILTKFKLLDGFVTGISNYVPGSGYIDFYQNNLLILSSRGVLAYTKNLNHKNHFKQIKNNINDFIGLKQFSKKKWFSLKDLFIHKNKIFISYTEEIKENCFNTSIIYGDINYEYIIFEKLFSPKTCEIFDNNINQEMNEKDFNAHQSGGKMISFDNDHILFSIGEYRKRYLAQDKESVNGKIIKINIENASYEIISMGHRNPQGLYFDKENNFIIESEHGPRGGDEINIIEVDKINNNKILNYGWPVVSAGEHYGSMQLNKKKYEKYPLYKSHSKYGFIEPLKSFVPSIGISELSKIKNNSYVVSSMKDKSLYFFEIDSEKKISRLERLDVTERVRDLKFYENKLYLFLEDTASIGVISLE